MKVTYTWYNWEVRVYSTGIIYLQSRIGLLNDDIGYKSIGREYDIPINPKEIEFDGSYINIRYEDGKMYQFKLEGDTCIIGDIWKDGELIDEIGMYDLYDDFF
jgi:hypothetical protein